ncbi:MAG: hypothetical protein UZ21_OP11001001055 [Microgenomates bacterium OLB22]|nr:MAG: hypothetical protein UZ21_OP11001001055 [Microgenomates bacterium OLB22]
MTETVLVLFQLLFIGICIYGTVASVVSAIVFGVSFLTVKLPWRVRLWNAALWFFGMMLVAVAFAYAVVFLVNALPTPL